MSFERVFTAWASLAACPVEKIRNSFKLDEFYGDHERGQITSQQYFAHLRDSLDLPLSDEQFLEGWNRIFGGEVPGMSAMVQQVARLYPVYVFSNTNDSHQKVWAQRYRSTLRVFDRIFTSHQIGRRKPDLQAYRWVTQQIKCAPEQVAFFDDSAKNVQGALAAGMRAMQFHSVADVPALVQLQAHVTGDEDQRSN